MGVLLHHGVGSIFVSGSNPNSDYNVGPNVPYGTEYRVEIFYPSYYNARRPQPAGLLSKLGYGGDYFDVTLDSDDLGGDVSKLKKTKVVIVRTGFSTHAMNMGQRFIELQNSHTGYANNTGTLHVHQLPPNPAVFPPGPALLFVIVDGVPSVGIQVMVGSGKIGKQKTKGVPELPTSSLVREAPTTSSSESGDDNGAIAQSKQGMWWILAVGLLCIWT